MLIYTYLIWTRLTPAAPPESYLPVIKFISFTSLGKMIS